MDGVDDGLVAGHGVVHEVMDGVKGALVANACQDADKVGDMCTWREEDECPLV